MPPTTHSESDSDDDLDYVPPADGTLSLCPRSLTILNFVHRL